MRDYVFIPHVSGYFFSQISGCVRTQELRRTLEMFLLSLFLLPRCDAEGGLYQLHSCAGEPHTRLVLCTNHVYACQFISAPTPSNLENPPADFQGCLSILFNSTTIWGNNVTMLLCLHFRQHQSGRFERTGILRLKKRSLEAWKLLVTKRQQFR